jgi:2-haloacid dehalogenase
MTSYRSPLRAVLFDAYGTLLDVHSVTVRGDALFPGTGAALSALWREKQLQYSWLRTMSGRYADFWQVTGDALDYAAERLGLSLTPEARSALMAEYERLAPFADAASALTEVARLGVPLAVLSNGTPHMLEAAFGAASLRDRFAALISIDPAQRYKTAPEAYKLAVDLFGGTPAEFVLVSSNGWDIAGGGHFGFGTFWVNRQAAPVERMGVAPSAIGTGLADLARWLAGTYTPT